MNNKSVLFQLQGNSLNTIHDSIKLNLMDFMLFEKAGSLFGQERLDNE